jgi:tRNA 2-thiouridine synthesizing protein A
MAEHVLNAEGLNCPLPILKAKKMLKTVPVGEVLEIRATDPGAVADFAAFCKQTGNELLSSTQEGDVFKFEIKRT